MLGQPSGEDVIVIRGVDLGLIRDRGHPESALEGAIAARTQEHAGRDTEDIFSYGCFPQN
jgi:hypothetical protein